MAPDGQKRDFAYNQTELTVPYNAPVWRMNEDLHSLRRANTVPVLQVSLIVTRRKERGMEMAAKYYCRWKHASRNLPI
jgi:hypothetical protein